MASWRTNISVMIFAIVCCFLSYFQWVQPAISALPPTSRLLVYKIMYFFGIVLFSWGIIMVKYCKELRMHWIITNVELKELVYRDLRGGLQSELGDVGMEVAKIRNPEAERDLVVMFRTIADINSCIQENFTKLKAWLENVVEQMK